MLSADLRTAFWEDLPSSSAMARRTAARSAVVSSRSLFFLRPLAMVASSCERGGSCRARLCWADFFSGFGRGGACCAGRQPAPSEAGRARVRAPPRLRASGTVILQRRRVLAAVFAQPAGRGLEEPSQRALQRGRQGGGLTLWEPELGGQ